MIPITSLVVTITEWGVHLKFRLVFGFSCRLRTPKVSRTAGTMGHDSGLRFRV